MIEISNQHEKIFNLLKELDFEPLDYKGNVVGWSDLNKKILNNNYFFKKSNK